MHVFVHLFYLLTMYAKSVVINKYLFLSITFTSVISAGFFNVSFLNVTVLSWSIKYIIAFPAGDSRHITSLVTIITLLVSSDGILYSCFVSRSLKV